MKTLHEIGIQVSFITVMIGNSHLNKGIIFSLSKTMFRLRNSELLMSSLTLNRAKYKRTKWT